jgi:hypothetical protein
MKRAVVTVATDWYVTFQDRLIAAVNRVDPECGICAWREIPTGWPSHQDRPYGFKCRALVSAGAAGNDLLLWCDAPIVPVRSMKPLWDRIEKDGYWIARNGWNNYEWTATDAYKVLFPDLSLNQARRLNKDIPHVVASAFGINVAHPVGQMLISEYFRLCDTEAICGPWKNAPETHCGPIDVLGHRHDQTILSVVAHNLGLKLTDCPDIFSYAPGADTSILVSDGGNTLTNVFAE